jgi:hypothetical protein
MVLVTVRSKQGGASIPTRASWLHQNMEEKVAPLMVARKQRGRNHAYVGRIPPSAFVPSEAPA